MKPRKFLNKQPQGTKRVILDTSFLILSLQLGIDPYFEIKTILGDATLIVYDVVLSEIRKLSYERSERGITARIVLQYLEKLISEGKVKVESSKNVKDVDVFLLLKAEKEDSYLATVDKELRKMARRLGVKTVFVRLTKKKIEID